MRSISKAVAAVTLGLTATLTATADATPKLATEQTIGHIEPVFEFYGAMPTGVTKAPDGRLFVNFPRWGDDVPFTVGEIVGKRIVPYPDAQTNRADPAHPADSLISVQSVVADSQNRLWILDTASPKLAAPIQGGAKLVAVDLATNKVVRTILLPPNALLPTTYLNDVRFDFRFGAQGIAYVTDSSPHGPGGIIVVDLASGEAWRKLSGDPSTSADAAFVPVVEGEEMATDGPDGKRRPLHGAADGIALSADGATLYYSPLSSRHLYSVPTALLRDRNASPAAVAAAVRDLGEKGASDGLEADASGAIYAGDYEHDSIRRRRPDGEWQTIAHDPRILWPDTLSVGNDGYLYFTANQLPRQASFHHGHDLRKKPYTLFRIRIDAKPVTLAPNPV
ncbi:Sugar lactone lactonase YvrE [Paraburkholderia phenazinium]|uniref:Sugar lactone lactonase YvrE n=1 Tax=Paraburkholderia phenazinium TaxID=60549 RepID=A0A1N6JC49_9BURK|nr:Sugar lactone lactonase YvrE [Paraburkholderia phenazinium]